jgi:hypothetical protein
MRSMDREGRFTPAQNALLWKLSEAQFPVPKSIRHRDQSTEFELVRDLDYWGDKPPCDPDDDPDCDPDDDDDAEEPQTQVCPRCGGSGRIPVDDGEDDDDEE